MKTNLSFRRCQMVPEGTASFGPEQKNIKKKKSKVRSPFKTERFIPVSFLIVILLGTLLLMIPAATVSGEHTGPLTALFTSTTSVCVTGLVVVDSFSHWTLFGKIVILLLIQLGGLGAVSVMSMIFVMFKKKFSLRERNLLQDAFNLNSRQGLLGFLVRVFTGTFIIEGIGALLYSFRFIPAYGILRGIWYSVFHSVSAFCNAGIDILGPDSLISYQSDAFMLVTTMFLIIMGGLGFVVWFDVLDTMKRAKKADYSSVKAFRMLPVHSNLVLKLTVALIAIGAVFIFIFESNNSLTMEKMGLGDKWLNSVFQSVTFRTAGFASIPQDGLTHASCIVGYILMFIGGSPIGTAGGVKTVTVFIVAANAYSFIRGRNETLISRRKVSDDMIRKASAIVTVSFSAVIIMIILLMASENIGMDDAGYEVFSALATVGLSRGLTPNLSQTGRILIIICMYLGRIGPISMAIFFTNKRADENSIGYPDGNFYVG